VKAFRRDGFLIVEDGLAAEPALERLRAPHVRLFEGEYETGIRPDEVSGFPAAIPRTRTRQLSNSWKYDSIVAGAARDRLIRLPIFSRRASSLAT
jgi:hypothetical protein